MKKMLALKDGILFCPENPDVPGYVYPLQYISDKRQKKRHAGFHLNSSNSQRFFTFVQVLFWITYGLMFAFAAVYLQDRGFGNTTIGLVLGSTYALSAFLQPAFSRLFSWLKLDTEKAICRVYTINILLAVIMLIAPLPDICIAVLVVIIFSLESSVQPCVDTLARRWTERGCTVDFGMSRGISSLMYSGMTAGMGFVLQHIAPAVLPAFYMATMGLMVIILSRIRVPCQAERVTAAAESVRTGKIIRKPGFLLMLCGIVCLSFGHVLSDRFMLQIMQSMNGGSQELGIAMAIASLVEFPMMMLYSSLRKRMKDHILLSFSGWAWLAKSVLILLARTPSAIYVAEILQFCSYGLYIPASVQLIAHLFPGYENLSAQALAGSAFTVGGVIATFMGGILLDSVGINSTLIVIVVMMLAGAILFTVQAAFGDLTGKRNPSVTTV